MKISTYGCALASAIAAVLCSLSVVAAQPWYELQIVIPAGTNGQLTTQFTGGWPLVVRATAAKGAPTYYLRGPLAIVASDPSGCFDKLFLTDPDGACLASPPMEVYTRLWIDTDMPGRQDSTGDSGVLSSLVDSAGGGSIVFRGTAPDGSTTLVAAGPDTGAEVLDGFGYGANDDWPQLVLLSNHGVGVVLDENFNRGPIEQRRNMAGILEWAAYDLADEKGRSVVSSGTIVPFGMFSPLIKVDEAVGSPDLGGRYSSNVQFRVDGGPIRSANHYCLSPHIYGDVLYGLDYELRAFLVNGIAPSVLSDMDADGDVDSVDAELSGLEVISAERSVRFRLWNGVSSAEDAPFNDRINRIYADLDGNGYASNAACRWGDIGPGKVRPPPF